MKVALCQIDVVEGDLNKNLLNIGTVLSKIDSSVELAVFPELVDLGYNLEQYRALSHSPWLDSSERLIEIAKECKLSFIVGGAFYEMGNLYNSQFYVTQDSVEVVYSKRHLFGNEKEFFTASSCSADILIKGVKIGFQICFDLRYPEVFRDSYPNLPEVVIISAAWPLARINHWSALLKARAIENQCFIVASNRVGVDNTLEFGGASQIISPNGETILMADNSNSSSNVATIIPQSVIELRGSFPVLL